MCSAVAGGGSIVAQKGLRTAARDAANNEDTNKKSAARDDFRIALSKTVPFNT